MALCSAWACLGGTCLHWFAFVPTWYLPLFYRPLEKIVISPADMKRKAHLATWLPAGSCPMSPALLQHYLLLLTSPGSSTTAFAESPHIFRHPMPCQRFPSPALVTLSSFLHLLWPLEISFTFSSPSYLLDQVLGWQVLGFGVYVWWLTAWQVKPGSWLLSCYNSLSQH